MARTRESRLMRGRESKEAGRAKRRADLSPATEQWSDLFRDLLRQDPDEDLADRVERHWLPDIRRGQMAGALPEEALFFLKGWALELLTEEKVRAAVESGGELRELSDRMRAVEEEHGVDRGEPWWPGEGPGLWEDLRREWQERVDGLLRETLEAHGEQEMARILREEPEDFERRMETGRRYLFGA